MNNKYIIEMKNISKHYPGVNALDNVNISIKPGEVRALVGENGAGKSTLMKILTGAETPTKGEIIINGKKISHLTPAISEKMGLSCVYQNLMLAEHLTVAENIWLGKLPSSYGILNKKALIKKTDDFLNQIGFKGIINPNNIVSDLTTSQMGMVAIVKAVSSNAKIIIFDEPTAVLSNKAVNDLFKIIKLLKTKKVAIFYISHRMEEIFKVCDSVSVLKDGVHVGDKKVSDMTDNKLITMMVGRELTGSNFDSSRQIGKRLLQVKNISNKKIKNCSLELNEGEIVGIYGLVGAGRTELSRAIFGADKVNSGKILINGKQVKIDSPIKAIKRKISLVPEDRRRQGLALQLSVKTNLNLVVYKNNGILGFVGSKREKKINNKYIKSINIKTPSGNEIVKNLSGGNQQKVVLGKWLANHSKIFIMDEPTNGIDVGAKEEIYSLINKLAGNSCGILCVSSYMPELMDICDRILVMSSGQIIANVKRKDFNEEKLLALAIQNI